MNGRFSVYKYNIEACWYGNRPEGTEPDSNCVKTVLMGLKRWVSSVASISETAINDDSFYIKECVGGVNGKYVVILWLTTSKDSHSTALDISSKPGGKSRVKQRKYPTGYKPGCPLYYYIDLTDMAVYMLKPDDATLIGKDVFEQLMRHVMMFHSGAVQQVLRDEKGEALIVGDVDLSPKKNGVFRLVQSLCDVEINEIISRASDIRKMVHTVRLDSGTQPIFEAFVTRLMKHLKIAISSYVEKDAKCIRYETNVNLDEESLRTLIEHQRQVGENEKIGFIVREKGGSRTLWADRTGNHRFVLPKIKPVKGVYSGSDLLKVLPKFIMGGK